MKDPVVEIFKARNPSFSSFFTTKKEKLFREKLSKISIEEKLLVRDYLLIPLHHFGQVNFANNSFLISTSISLDRANEFADDIIFVGWSQYSGTLKIPFAESLDASTLERLKIPAYKLSFYPREREFTLKGGLLPHYTIGFINKRTKEFIINNHFFTDNRSFVEIISTGIEIDQAEFLKIHSTTNLRGYFSVRKGNIYSDSIKSPGDSYHFP